MNVRTHILQAQIHFQVNPKCVVKALDFSSVFGEHVEECKNSLGISKNGMLVTFLFFLKCTMLFFLTIPTRYLPSIMEKKN